jgi:predicted alpha/beta superfamily hydrolase
VSEWQPYPPAESTAAHTVTGTVLVKQRVYSAALSNHRDVYLYLPPSYKTSERRYPVLYMHDGQNLFDAASSFAGEWGVDETLQRLSAEGIEAIVVGIANIGEGRMKEYLPFKHPYFGEGKGDTYLKFLVETVKHDVDHHFRTLPDRAHTGIAGSSMGGLISLYGYFCYPSVFGMAGVVSPALWPARPNIFTFVEAAAYSPGRIYFDIGTEEFSGYRQIRQGMNAIADHQRMISILSNKGYKQGESLMYVEDQGGKHNEADWARRLPDALRFLLKS